MHAAWLLSRFLLCALALAASPAPAKAAPRMVAGLDVDSFCSAVAAGVLENEPRHALTLYRYQSMLERVSGVRATDDENAYARRISGFLRLNLPGLTCNQINFTPRNGNILKLAVARQNNSFIEDALGRWDVDPNVVDATDGKTVLDYIRDRRDEVGSSSFGRTLDRYYRKFRAAGAKHAEELGR